MLILSTSFSFFFYSITPPTLQPTSQLFLTHLLYIFSSLLSNFLFTFFPSCHFPTIFHSFGIFSSSNPVFSPFTSMFFNSFRYHPVTLLSSFPPFPSVFHTLPPVNPPSMVPRINCQQFSLNDLNGTKIGQIISMLNPDNVVNLGVREGAKSRREWGG